ncbi:hypothetical protein [Lujinxingia sediminis]|uniref:hypothetical protein n=1 Tax=Lujinxingia sediminis TaxID=2480984 RepID=UPI0013E33566|nr:hypothetical protein [Lujinxingia sediminis]
MAPTHPWTFRPRFRRNAFGWRSQPAMQRIEEAVAEIKDVAAHDPALAAEGAVIFFEKLSPAIAQVDSSSGAIRGTVNRAIAELTTIIGAAPASEAQRATWLQRLWDAGEADDIPYLEALGDHWGAACGSVEVASEQADRLLVGLREAWEGPKKEQRSFTGESHCLSALLAAERYEEVLAWVEKAPYTMWSYVKFGVKALVAMGQPEEAVAYAEARSEGRRSPAVAYACETILRDAGMEEEAYANYAFVVHEHGSYLSWFRGVAKAYPAIPKARVLADLVAHTPGKEGKWFAAARSAKLYDEAIRLVQRSPGEPKTLMKAAKAETSKRPKFAVQAGLAALRWQVEGHGYKAVANDARDAFAIAMRAAEAAGEVEAVRAQVRAWVENPPQGENKMVRMLRECLGEER